ncbi:MAG TPA: NAD(P)H-dependent oxidoreductase [Tenuifilaceae bacterium]|nr:NAD(P)H-dependent oxidoreductase [Tenuifilaceae bacterium]
MKITILNGDVSQDESAFSNYIDRLAEALQQENTVNMFRLNKMNLHYCTGCWSCWWKTPGKCPTNDDAEQIYRSVVSSDLVIFASPLVAGFTSAVLKKITDRFVALIHPYIKLFDGECHHQNRYDKNPDIALVLEKEADTDNEDLEIVNDIYKRFALNLHSNLRFTKIVDHDKIEDIVHATHSI